MLQNAPKWIISVLELSEEAELMIGLLYDQIHVINYQGAIA